MADITLSQQQVQQVNAEQTGLNASPEDAPDTNVIMPAKQLDLTPDENNKVSLQDQIAQSSQTSVAFSPRQLEQLKDLMGQPAPQETAPQQPSDPNGLPRIDELDLNQQSSLPNDPQSPEQPEQPTTFEIPDDDNAKRFKESFEKYLGFPLEDLKTYSEQFRQQQEKLQQIEAVNYHNSSIQSLASEWGVDFNQAEGRLNEIKERFQQYNPDMQKRLDNLEGAKLIWSRLELERSQRGQVPQFQRSSSMSQVGKANEFLFTESQLDNMSKEEYERNADRIYQAYAMGLVQQK